MVSGEQSIIEASLRNELQKAHKDIQVLNDEIAVLKYENDRLKRIIGQRTKQGKI